MFRKKSEKIIENMNRADGQSYWAIVKREFRKNRLAFWSWRFLILIMFVGLFANFIANEKPFYCKINGKTYYPIFNEVGQSLGIADNNPDYFKIDWYNDKFDKIIRAPIPYSAATTDLRNSNYRSPMGPQDVPSKRFWHWLGTDNLGHDVAAGMIMGTRTAMLVGIIAMSIATFIGIIFGLIAGFFGDDKLRMSRGRIILNIVGVFFATFYGFMTRSFQFVSGHFLTEVFKSLFIFFTILAVFNLLAKALKFLPFFAKKITIPADLIIMRLIEVFTSIPLLLLIFAVSPIIKEPSIFNVMIIIGLIAWTGVARFVRAELLRIRKLEYIEAAQALGFTDLRITLKHALPNALTPVLITIAFGIASAILIEAILSFLGIGVNIAKDVTWGSMLNQARSYFSAWWLAIFPGIAIFITVTLFNLIGDGLTDALDPRNRS